VHEDDDLKNRVERLLGVSLFVCNLESFGLWDGLILDCTTKALKMGEEMQQYFAENNLGTVLGETAVPNVFGKIVQEDTLPPVVVDCGEDYCSRRQDAVALAAAESVFPWSPNRSQLWNEKCYIHYLRMLAMGIDASFQDAVKGVCLLSKGGFQKAAIKGHTRMRNKCTSKTDHYKELFPRPALNIDINRNCCTFENPDGLILFIRNMKKHPRFGGQPVRIKNMFLYDDRRARQQFHYRTVMINWLYTPGITYRELAEEAGTKWSRCYDYKAGKDPAESWSAWRTQIRVAMAHLTSEEMAEKKVHFIVETQLLLHPYLAGRLQMVTIATSVHNSHALL
jgi:hypothetical protein